MTTSYGSTTAHLLLQWLIYLRKSRQDDPNETVEEVLAKHEIQLQEWAERELGGRIPEENIYREVISGESISEREEIKKVLARLEDPNIKGVIVIEPSRLSRGNLSDCQKIIDSFRFSKSLVATPYMTYNMENKMERKFFQDELLRSNEFLEYTKSILWRGRVAACKRGCFIATIPPYGYKKIKIGKDHTLEIIEEQAEIVRLVFDLYIKEGLTPFRIAERLNNMGIPAPLGGKWPRDTIHNILRNEHYAGYVVYNKFKDTQLLENGEIVTRRLQQPEDEWIIAEGKHKAIIDRKTWEAAKTLVARHPKVNTKRELLNPFAGMLVCGKCGRAMKYHVAKKADDRFTCKSKPLCFKSVKASAVYDAVIAALEQSELPALELKAANDDGNAIKIQRNLLAKLEKQMQDYIEQEDRQYELLETNPNYSQAVFERRNAQLRAKMEECQAAIYKAKSTLPESVDYAERVEKMKTAIDVLKDDKATANDKNKVLKAIVEKIEYTGPESDNSPHRWQNRTGSDPFNLDITLRL
jgi:DNA invertase Pin-like site-specific DNA recombinase